MQNLNPAAQQIYEQLGRLLLTKEGQSELIGHNLEKGLGNEQALRELLSGILPRCYGVAKGKLVNTEGAMSRQLDVIIYDANHCPTLFSDEHRNQIIPVEGAYAVLEVKSTLKSSDLGDAFETLASVSSLLPRIDRSTNDHQVLCPPFLEVFAFSSPRSLNAVADQYRRLSQKYPVERSTLSYSKKSPAFKDVVKDTFLIGEVTILNVGSVFHMLDGTINVAPYEQYSLGMFITSLIDRMSNLRLPRVWMMHHFNYIMVEQWTGKQSSFRASRRGAT